MGVLGYRMPIMVRRLTHYELSYQHTRRERAGKAAHC